VSIPRSAYAPVPEIDCVLAAASFFVRLACRFCFSVADAVFFDVLPPPLSLLATAVSFGAIDLSGASRPSAART
jgi:hypothetical protein